MQTRVIPDTDLGMRIAKLELSQYERREPSHDSADIRPDSVERGPAEIAHA